MAILKPQHTNIPWLVIHEFPSYVDAKAFQDLLTESTGEPSVLRKKNVVFSQSWGNRPAARALREHFRERDFTREDLSAKMADLGYSGTTAAVNAFLHNGCRFGVLAVLSRGVYQFLPAAPALPQGGRSLPEGEAFQPLPISFPCCTPAEHSP